MRDNQQSNDGNSSELAQVLIEHMDKRFDEHQDRFDHRFGFRQEYMEDRFSILQEGLEAMMDKRLSPIRNDIREVKEDVKVVKAVITDQSSQLRTHEARISALES